MIVFVFIGIAALNVEEGNNNFFSSIFPRVFYFLYSGLITTPGFALQNFTFIRCQRNQAIFTVCFCSFTFFVIGIEN